MKQLQQIDLSGKKIFIRADLNLSTGEEYSSLDQARIRRILPTLNYIKENGGAAIIASHRGSPKGKTVAALSLQPVAEKLSESLGTEVDFLGDCVGETVHKTAFELAAGKFLLLENLRFHIEEEQSEPLFAKRLSKLADVYVNDAFSIAHEKSASTVLLPSLFQEKAAGLLFQKEINYFQKAIENPERPLCIVLGGTKLSNKRELLFHLASKADKLLIGGAMANTILAAQGFQMGRSLYEPDQIPKALELLGTLARNGCKAYLPVDFRVGDSPKSQGIARNFTAQEIPADTMALDIGPATSILFDEAITNAQTILWSGPMGKVENEDYSQGTTDLIQSLAAAHGITIAGGKDTEAAIRMMELEHKFNHISSGNNAFLSLLEGKALPALSALR